MDRVTKVILWIVEAIILLVLVGYAFRLGHVRVDAFVLILIAMAIVAPFAHKLTKLALGKLFEAELDSGRPEENGSEATSNRTGQAPDPGPAPKVKQKVSLDIPQKYKNWIDTLCRKMDIEKLVDSQDKKLISLTLPEIFIPLYTSAPGAREEVRKKPAETEEERLELAEERQAAVDIEQLAADSDYLLIKGQAGSGKTTLLKHMAYTIIHKNNENGLNGYLPVLIFLKGLPDLEIDMDKAIPGTLTAEKFMEEYFKTTADSLSLDLIRAFCQTGRAIFLIDGLDEIEPKLRKLVVASLANFRTDYECSKVILSGRPHGIDAPVNDHFGDKCAEINSLNMEQVELFIGKWCESDEELQARGKTAAVMFGEIREHPGIEELLSTPLMLTAACILYHYDKKLPDQRAELYEKFTSNLIYKRFENPLAVQYYLMKLASNVHHARKRDFDESFAINLFVPEYPMEKDESERHYRQRLKARFDNIEQNCGLLKLDGGQYSFWHLTFQEFLTAREIAVHERDHAKAIQKYWDDEWYEEVIQLFFGHLSTSGRAIANGIIEDELDKPESSPFRHWRLASKALLGIHADMRNAPVVAKARERLPSIFDREAGPEVLAEAGETLGWLGDPRDLKEFVAIEGGEFELEKEDSEELDKVTIDPFELGRYPVTNMWYAEFIEAGGYKNEDYWSKEGKKWLKNEKPEFPLYWDERRWKCPNSPVVGVSLYEAEAFCRWLTMAGDDEYKYYVPSEEQWQAAAAGKGRRDYPWGSWKDNVCNTDESGIGKTSPVGIFKEGKTLEGIADMSGNVFEWTDSRHEKDKRAYVLRGGSWVNFSRGARCANRSYVEPFGRSGNIGFRCARTWKE